MSIAALIRSMAAAGAPPEAIAIAVEAIEASGTAIAERRAADRERKRRQRDSRGTVTGQSRDETVTKCDTPSLDKESFPQTPFKEINPNPVCEVRARGSRIPADWQPTKSLPANVKSLTDLWPPGRYERELDGFRDYWTSRQRNAAMLDWDKGWWNRIRSQHDTVMRQVGNGQHRNGSKTAGRSGDGFLDAIREARERRANDDGRSACFEGMG